MNVTERLRQCVEWLVLLPVRIRHRRSAGRRHRARAEAITTTRNTLTNAKAFNASAIQAVFNVGLYLLLLDQDLADFTDDMVYAIGVHRRRFVAKHEAILLYEAAEDLPQLLGKRLGSP